MLQSYVELRLPVDIHVDAIDVFADNAQRKQGFDAP